MTTERNQPPVLQLNRRFAVIVIANDVNQLASVATLPARLLMLTGRICNRAKIVAIKSGRLKEKYIGRMPK